MRALYVTALSNNVEDIRLISGDELRTIEPHCRVRQINQKKIITFNTPLPTHTHTHTHTHTQGKMAIHSPNTGIVDWALVTRAYADDFREAGGTIYTGFEVCYHHNNNVIMSYHHLSDP